MASPTTPSTITGGCLCGSIRYTVTFPPSHDFSTAVGTCQCTQCRKSTGTLYLHVHAVPLSAVVFASKPTLTTYRASPYCARAFCSACGGMLYWRDERTDMIDLSVGGFDEQALSEWGTVLTKASKHYWCGHEIEGVSDGLEGRRWRGSPEGEDAVEE
ncbi:hypothetical protein G7046_g7526 [Stylonectria norvegica]|nr:hypothetical protein G7046_g7526 [Stylonectria norvegica]